MATTSFPLWWNVFVYECVMLLQGKSISVICSRYSIWFHSQESYETFFTQAIFIRIWCLSSSRCFSFSHSIRDVPQWREYKTRKGMSNKLPLKFISLLGWIKSVTQKRKSIKWQPTHRNMNVARNLWLLFGFISSLFPVTKSSTWCYNADIDIVIDIVFISLILFGSRRSFVAFFTRVQLVCLFLLVVLFYEIHFH